MLGSTFYHQTIRKYVAAFGTLFNDLNIERKNSSDVVIERMKVPLAYGPKQKWLLAIAETTTNRKVTATRTPRMGFSLTGLSYDSVRKLNTIQRNVTANTSGTTVQHKFQYNPVPYNFDFTLYILVKNAEDGTQILEQILPYFTPQFTVTINTIPDMGIKADIPIILNSADVADEYEGDLATRRTITWTLSFTMKGYVYPDIKSGEVIKTIEVNFRIPGAAKELPDDPEFIILEDSDSDTTNYILLNGYGEDYDGSYVAPNRARVANEKNVAGLTDATIKSRYTVVPAPLSATADSDYGFSETFEFFEEGKFNDPTTGSDIDTY